METSGVGVILIPDPGSNATIDARPNRLGSSSRRWPGTGIILIAASLLGCDAPAASSDADATSPADLRSPPHVLEPDLEIGGGEADLVWVADVAGLPDGSFLLLDRSRRMVSHWEQGRLREIAGGEGEGPGEFSDPVALATGPDRFAVLDRAALRVSWFLFDGTHLTTRSLEDSGDLHTAMARGPMRGIYSPFYGHVDFADRFHPAADGVLLELEDNELLSFERDRDPRPSRSTHLVLIAPDVPPDTVLSLDAPPVRVDRRPNGAIRAFGPPVYHPSMAWHSSEDRLVVVRPENGLLELQSIPEGEPTLRIDWPEAGPISDRDRVNAQLWSLQRWMPHFTTREARDRYRTDEARRRYAERNAAITEYSDVRPAVTDVFLADFLLWIAGFSSEDSPEGISSTWTLVDPVAAELVGRVRFPFPGERLRDIEGCRAYTADVDDGGLFIVRRYALPAWACS